MTTTATPALPDAVDLGYLLHKHPDRAQAFDLAFGTAHVVYPEVSNQRCTAALLLDVDPVALVRRSGPAPGGRGHSRRGGAVEAFTLGQYVNDRPYAASSLLAVAIGKVFRTAMTGRCNARPDAAASSLDLDITVPALPCRGGAALAIALFTPLGWQVDASPVPLDPAFPEWGDSRYVRLRLRGSVRLSEALNHLYVLLPVLDDAKHYWVSPDEVEKLVRAGEGWLGDHPDRALITRRYLRNRYPLVRSALERLAEVDDTAVDELDNAVPAEPAEWDVSSDLKVTVEPERKDEPHLKDEPEGDPSAAKPMPLARQRISAVVHVLAEAGAQRVLDLGCGEGALVGALIADHSFTEILGADVSHRALLVASRKLRLARLPERQRERVRLVQSALTYRDRRLEGFDAAVLMEVIEHVDVSRLSALERAVFDFARPGLVVVTTPNVEHNVCFDWLSPGELRHRDHRFEGTRAEFHLWADATAGRHGYAVRYLGVGTVDPVVGPPTQVAVFTRSRAGAA